MPGFLALLRRPRAGRGWSGARRWWSAAREPAAGLAWRAHAVAASRASRPSARRGARRRRSSRWRRCAVRAPRHASASRRSAPASSPRAAARGQTGRAWASRSRIADRWRRSEVAAFSVDRQVAAPGQGVAVQLAADGRGRPTELPRNPPQAQALDLERGQPLPSLPTSDASRPPSHHPELPFSVRVLPQRPRMLRFTPESAGFPKRCCLRPSF